MKTYPLTHYEFMIKDNFFNYKETNEKIMKEFGTDPIDFMAFASQLITSKIDEQQFIGGSNDQVSIWPSEWLITSGA
jgi:hypothetical protein